MAYEFEKAKHLGYTNLVKNTGAIFSVIDDLQIVPSKIKYTRLDDLVFDKYDNIKDTKLKHIFIIDGSKHESVINKKEADFSVGVISINQCVIDVKNYGRYINDPFPLPNEYNKLKNDFVISELLPLKGLSGNGQNDSRDLFRNTFYNIVKARTNPIVSYIESLGYKVNENESLLETYMFIANKISATVVGNIQPCEICKSKNNYVSIKKFKNEKNSLNHSISCSCEENPKNIYVTDFLQFHEQLNTETTDGAVTTQIMLALEKLLMVNLLRIIEKNKLFDLIKDSAFVMDGTLAVYSHSTWLSGGIGEYIYDLKQNHELLLLGVEKTGQFEAHFKKINDYYSEEPLKRGMLFFLNDDYIKNNIKIYQNDKFYGEKNYFGKKLFYKSHTDRLYIINLAFENEADKYVDYNKRNEKDYIAKCQRINDLIMLLENFTSQAYTNALVFVAMANEGVSIRNTQEGKSLVNDFVNSIFKINS